MIAQITKADYTDKKGVALITVLGTLLFVSLIGITILQIAISHSGLSYHQINRQRAYYASQGGLEYAMWQTRNNQTIASPLDVGGLSVTVTRTPGGHPTLGASGYTLNTTVDY